MGVSSSIAAYKAADLASRLAKEEGCDTHVLMTKNATEFISPTVFETLTGNKCVVDTFDRNFRWDVEHVALAKKADAFVVAPATANIIAKIAHGLADDMLTTTILAARCPKIIAPAMNTAMYENVLTQQNIEKLKELGYVIVEPSEGILACKDVGKGKLASLDMLYASLECTIAYEKDLQDKRVLITAGPTQEALDPVRFITNHSSGKMGYAFAKAAALRGASVTLVSGPVSLPAPYGVTTVPAVSAQEMYQAVVDRSEQQDIFIMAAAVSDYRPATVSMQKIKKSADSLEIRLKQNPDILAHVGKHKKDNQFVCGFAMETENLAENAIKKCQQKNADMIVANSLSQPGAGFEADTNVVSIIIGDVVEQLPLMPKEELAHILLDKIKSMHK